MTALIVGGAGFIGLSIAEHFLSKGEEVVLFDRNALNGVAAEAFAALPGTYTFVQGDIIQAEPIAEVTVKHQPSRIFYGAAVTSGPERELEAPEMVIQVNLVGLAHTLKAARSVEGVRLINISSGAAYGTGAMGETGWVGPLDEYATREEPFKIYGMTKYGSERLVRRYRELSGMDALSVRLSTIFGPWEIDSGARDTLSAPMQAALLARAGGAATFARRDHLDWTYSRYVAGALDALIEAPRAGITSDIFNITTAKQVSVLDMCAVLKKHFPDFTYRLVEPGEEPSINLWGDKDRHPMKPDRLTFEAGHRLPNDIEATVEDFAGWIKQHGAFWGG